jgi:hypothetical protein
MAGEFCPNVLDIADIVDAPDPTPGALPRDPDDDKIVARRRAQYLVSRDCDLLSLASCAGIAIVAPMNSHLRTRFTIRSRHPRDGAVAGRLRMQESWPA